MNKRREELVGAIMQVLEKSKDSRTVARSIASYLIDERQTKELDSLLRNLEQVRFDNDGVLEVEAVAARPLSAEAKEQIKQLFDAKSIQIHEKQDKSLLGGVRVRALDKVADLSVQARLRRLRAGKGL